MDRESDGCQRLDEDCIRLNYAPRWELGMLPAQAAQLETSATIWRNTSLSGRLAST